MMYLVFTNLKKFQLPFLRLKFKKELNNLLNKLMNLLLKKPKIMKNY